MAEVVWQPSLLGGAEGGGDDGPVEPAVDRSFAGLARLDLDATAWVEHVPAWVRHADVLFETLLAEAAWKAHARRMYDGVVDEPRLRAPWRRSDRTPLVPVIGDMLAALSERYERQFVSGGLNLYRDGRDSVAWHGDRIPEEIVDPVVAIVSLGHPRTFRLRPKGGGPSRALVLRNGDLLVTGGSTQRTWDHAIPKTASAGPRISVTFRHGA